MSSGKRFASSPGCERKSSSRRGSSLPYEMSSMIACQPSYSRLASDEVVDHHDTWQASSRAVIWLSIASIIEAVIILLFTFEFAGLLHVQTGFLVSTPIPRFEHQIVEFVEDYNFRGLKDVAQVTSAWDGWKSSPGLGFVHIHDPLKYGLRPNHHVIPGVQDAYMISFAHQLHCLRQLQTMLVGLASKNGTASFGDFERNHAEHCFNYIRQGIMCSGDMTLEGPDEKQEVGESALRGWGVEHRCVDWGQMLAWVDQNAAVSRH